MNTTPTVRADHDVSGVLSGLHRVVVATDAADERLAQVRRVATRLAVDHGWELVLYDRSHERWSDTPHPRGPVSHELLDRDEWNHLVIQMQDIEAAGVRVHAWLATVPSITAMLDVLRELDVDAVLLPDELGDATLVDRLLAGDDPAATIEDVADRRLTNSQPTFLVVDADGELEVLDSDDGK